MAVLILGGVLIGGAAVLDSLFRWRMSRIGYKWAIILGGAFNYSHYHKVRKQHGWAAWPVYLMWAMWICGIAFPLAGFLMHSGRQ